MRLLRLRRQRQNLVAFIHPRGKPWRPLRRFPHRDRPMIQPSRPFLPNESIGKPLRLIAQPILQRDEPVSALAYYVNELVEVLSLHLICVQKQNLFGLISKQLLGQLFGIGELRIRIRQILFHEFLLRCAISTFLGLFVHTAKIQSHASTVTGAILYPRSVKKASASRRTRRSRPVSR